MLTAVAGFFLGFIVFGFLIASIFTVNVFILWAFLLVSTGVGFYIGLDEKRKDVIEIHITAFIGAYLIIRGISFFFENPEYKFPNEAQVFY